MPNAEPARATRVTARRKPAPPRAAPRPAPRAVIEELTRIPGVGPIIAANMYHLGVRQIADLRGGDPEALYQALCRLEGAPVDRCALYVFRCAVYFASESKPDAELLKWWHWKDS
jgi:hypothetical protein